MKKIIVLGLFILFGFMMISCDEVIDNPSYTAQEVIDTIEIIYQDGDDKDHITGHIIFPSSATIDVKVKLTWSSDNKDVIADNGSVNRLEDDVTVNVTYTVDNYGSSFTGTITMTVIGTSTETNTGEVSTYTVNIYLENIEDEGYTLSDTTTLDGYVGDQVFANPETIEGFTINNTLNKNIGTILAGDALELELYYDRVHFEVTLYIDEVLSETLDVKYGETLDLADPTKTDYEFVEWRLFGQTTAYDFDTLTTNDFRLDAFFKVIDSFSYTGYYDGADGLYGENLVTFLHTILNNGFVGVTYGDARYMLDDTDQDPNNTSKVVLVYEGTSVSGVWDYGVTWNREHVWPQSLLGVSADNDKVNSASDLHNLKPADPGENSYRSNKYFGYGDTSQIYEPRDEVKGDIARILFYMDIMYTELSLIHANEGATYQMGDLDTLLAWHEADPVDDFELFRNESIYGYQHNRNPFIDHPEFVEKIYGSVSDVSIEYDTFSYVTTLNMVDTLYKEGI